MSNQVDVTLSVESTIVNVTLSVDSPTIAVSLSGVQGETGPQGPAGSGGGGGGGTWGSIAGTLSAQTDLQAALDAKQAADADLTAISALDSTSSGVLATDGSGWIRKTYTALKTALALVKADVGLGSVDNTPDASKPVSTAQAAADAAVQAFAIQRGNHTGFQTASTISDFTTAADARVAAAIDTDTTLAADSDAKVPSQHAVKTAIAFAVTGLLDFKSATDASANPNYPSASKGDTYVVSVAGKVGGASGKSVDIGDMYLAIADNAGGTEASVGTSWVVLEHNLVGALLGANNLSDVANASTARSNLGLAIGSNVQAWSSVLDAWAGKTVPSGSVVGTTDTQTETNKRITPRIGTVASAGTPVINTDNVDQFNITALAAAITSFTTSLTGTPTDGDTLIIRIKDNGTARAITHGTSFVSSGVAALLTTTVISKTHTEGFRWDAAAAKWVCLFSDPIGY